ncbi:hypothetical protein FYK55_06720 [Roseiconus nitratireducens]|uniref:Uncharacterized protein n=1 Tax=Roseiconus nitratireducens TaxID=2605748 RepID=A0A5M6DD62_9BACT|nr:hypothetical protein [Roseiconus nitratireducens]KAA5545343.1 hypothetical protein FYK55_06720 [Roseiconus nitratireducens]
MMMLLQAAALAAVSVLPGTIQPTNTTRATVDLVELNHFIDESGREVFQQVVFFDWSTGNRQFEVRAWRLVKDPSQLPRRSWSPSGYLVTWQDKDLTREVWAKNMRETWSQQDPERVNRELLPESQRRPLWGGKPEFESSDR